MSDINLQSLPKLIFITGIDGSGKTLFTEKLVHELQKKGVPAEHIWQRFNNITSKPLLAFCRLIRLSYYEEHEGARIGYHDFEKSKVITWLFVFFQIIDTWLVMISKTIPKLVRGKILVCDRGSYDTLIDVMVDTKKSTLKDSFVGKLFLIVLPKARQVFFILRDPEKIFQSRPDVRLDKNFDFRYYLYETSAKQFSWTVIHNNGNPEDTFKRIIAALTRS